MSRFVTPPESGFPESAWDYTVLHSSNYLKGLLVSSHFWLGWLLHDQIPGSLISWRDDWYTIRSTTYIK